MHAVKRCLFPASVHFAWPLCLTCFFSSVPTELELSCSTYRYFLWPALAALWNRAGHYIFILWFFLLFLAYSQLSQIWCLPYFQTWCGLSADLECMSEMCCMWLAENTGRKKLPKIHHLGTIAQLCRAISSQLRHVLTIEKNLLNSNISSTCAHNMATFGPLAAEIGLPVWGIPANFNGFWVLVSLLHRRLSTEVNLTLHCVWLSLGQVHYMYVYVYVYVCIYIYIYIYIYIGWAKKTGPPWFFLNSSVKN